MKDLKVLAITHKQSSLSNIGLFHINDEQRNQKLNDLKAYLGASELLYLSTCNRVEFVIVEHESTMQELTEKVVTFFEVPHLVKELLQYQNGDAVLHLMEMASSLDSMVLGEREIITQFKNAYVECKAFGLTGDFIRILERHVVLAAKKVYTETRIAQNPVSVVSLAFKQFETRGLHKDGAILVIGAGQTNTNFCRFLYKAGYSNIHIFNRSIEKAEKLANLVSGKAYALVDLPNFSESIEAVVVCTGADYAIVTPALLSGWNLANAHTTMVDLSVPENIGQEVKDSSASDVINVENIEPISRENLKKRKEELIHCNAIIAQCIADFEHVVKERKVELAMQEIPKTIKDIKSKALQEVFAKDIATLDQNSIEVLNKMADYLEKKYISVPYKMAKEILLTTNPNV